MILTDRLAELDLGLSFYHHHRPSRRNAKLSPTSRDARSFRSFSRQRIRILTTWFASPQAIEGLLTEPVILSLWLCISFPPAPPLGSPAQQSHDTLPSPTITSQFILIVFAHYRLGRFKRAAHTVTGCYWNAGLRLKLIPSPLRGLRCLRSMTTIVSSYRIVPIFTALHSFLSLRLLFPSRERGCCRGKMFVGAAVSFLKLNVLIVKCRHIQGDAIVSTTTANNNNIGGDINP